MGNSWKINVNGDSDEKGIIRRRVECKIFEIEIASVDKDDKCW